MLQEDLMASCVYRPASRIREGGGSRQEAAAGGGGGGSGDRHAAPGGRQGRAGQGTGDLGITFTIKCISTGNRALAALAAG